MGHHWTRDEDDYLRHHAMDGAQCLSRIVGVGARELTLHAMSIGVDVPPRPAIGERCPWCGGRMTPAGIGYASGLCDACYRRHERDVKSGRAAEAAEILVSWSERQDARRHGQDLR